MLTQAEREQLIASIQRLPAALEEAAKGLTEEQLDTRVGEEEWTIRQVIHHVADANLNFFARTKWILTEERPALKLFDQEAWTGLPDATRAPIEASLLILKGLHERWVILLQNMPESGWRRVAVHPEQGEVVLEDLLANYTRHSEIHLEQIAQIRAAKG